MIIYQVDAFTDKAFGGNPAAVCILKEAAEEELMQKIAMEMNVSETAFLYKTGNSFNLRWFTPEVEVDLCGHATLASSYILWETGLLKKEEEAVFNTRSGRLTAKKNDDLIILDFPMEVDTETEANEIIEKALGVKTLYTGKNRMDYIVEVESEEIVRSLNPNFDVLKALNTRGVIVTSKSDSENYDFISRFFAPGAGIAEDPVTGSAHCCLGPYWMKRLGKNVFKAYQASKRGGTLDITVDGDRVKIGGKAVSVLVADMLI
jgi:PhzF family phenazine biosynthesis protein